MTRVSDHARSQLMLNQLLRLQQQSFETERQVSTGKKAQYYKDIPKDTGVLLSAKAFEARTEQYQETGLQVLGRLDLQNVQLQSLADAADDLRQTVLDSVSIGSGIGLMAQVTQIYETAVGILNTQVDGKYIYSGTRSDTPPVNAPNIADLIAAPSAAAVFDNNDLKQSVRIDDGVVVEFGVLASDIATDLFNAIKQIADYDANGATGPFQNTLTGAQRTFLQGEVANLRQVANVVTQDVAANGALYRQVQGTLDRHESTDIYLKGFISDIEDVDVAEAITRLNQNQVATEASMELLSRIGRLSLLDFI